jgi:RHS repeat-associated protein
MRFPGQLFDSESGLHYNYFRDYEPGGGRYIESDPIGLDGGISTYGYVTGNPLIAIDELGLSGRKSGGPYHPPVGVKTKCRASDTCSSATGKAWVLMRMITSHQGWDWRNPLPRGGNRHAREIRDLWVQYAECAAIAAKKCAEKCKKIKIPVPKIPVLPVFILPPGYAECGQQYCPETETEA